MKPDHTNCRLVKKAIGGCDESLSQLSRLAEKKVRAYIFGVTLDQDLTGDLVQESLLQMIQSLQQLKDANRFWPWMYRIAQSKIQQHYKDRKHLSHKQQKVPYVLEERHSDSGLNLLEKKERTQKVLDAIARLKQGERAALVLRCFEQLSYAEIAQTLVCNEVGARVQVHRAKQALKRQLLRQGLSKSMLFSSLYIFNRATTRGKAATLTQIGMDAQSVPALTGTLLKTDFITSCVSVIVSKASCAILLASAIIAGALVHKEKLSPLFSELPRRAQVYGLHYTQQSSRDNVYRPTNSLSKGAYEQWWYFPEGLDGPAFSRTQRWSSDRSKKLCRWLQNSEGNYYISGNKVFMVNGNLARASLAVKRLPSDTPELDAALNRIEGKVNNVTGNRDWWTGNMVSRVDNRFSDARNFKTAYQYNTVDASFFNTDLPENARIIDERDAMRQRGWTYFRITGHWHQQPLTGLGRIPFFYQHYLQKKPWLMLSLGQEGKIVDTPQGALLQTGPQSQPRSYPAQTFFTGLTRPWMGLHTVDLIRREAASKGFWYDLIKPKGNKEGEEDKDASITLTLTDPQKRHEHIQVAYQIDLANDWVESITVLDTVGTTATEVARLEFEYLQTIEGLSEQFPQPTINQSHTRARPHKSLWLFDLARSHK